MLFAPKLVISQRAGQKSVLKSGGLLGQSISVVPRAHSSFRRVRLSGASNDAIKALELKILKEANAGQSGYKIVKSPHANFANVWMFDKDTYDGMRVLPESLLYPNLQHGARLIECIEGVEGQVWENNELVASRWWVQPPAESQWMSFLRVVPIELNEADVLPISLKHLNIKNNIPLFDIDFTKFVASVTPLKVAYVAGFVSVACLGYFVTQISSLSLNLRAVEIAKSQISEEAQIVLSKRRRALKTISDIEKFTQLGSDRVLIDILSDVASVIGGQDVFVEQIRLEPDKVELSLSNRPQISGPDLVSALEQTKSLFDVNVSEAPQRKYMIQANYSSTSPETDSDGGIP